MPTLVRYSLALGAGLLMCAAGLVAGAAVAGLDLEAAFLGSAIGGLLGLAGGGWAAARVAQRALPSTGARWLVLFAIAPGVWLALFAWTVELRRSGVQSEYFQELLLPGMFGIGVGLAGAAWGARGSPGHSKLRRVP